MTGITAAALRKRLGCPEMPNPLLKPKHKEIEPAVAKEEVEDLPEDIFTKPVVLSESKSSTLLKKGCYYSFQLQSLQLNSVYCCRIPSRQLSTNFFQFTNSSPLKDLYVADLANTTSANQNTVRIPSNIRYNCSLSKIFRVKIDFN